MAGGVRLNRRTCEMAPRLCPLCPGYFSRYRDREDGAGGDAESGFDGDGSRRHRDWDWTHGRDKAP